MLTESCRLVGLLGAAVLVALPDGFDHKHLTRLFFLNEAWHQAPAQGSRSVHIHVEPVPADSKTISPDLYDDSGSFRAAARSSPAGRFAEEVILF
jgi:hypothetical protein